MKVELKQIINQLTETIGLDNKHKVSALIDDNGDIVGWTIVEVFSDGTIVPQSDCKYNTIKELIDAYR